MPITLVIVDPQMDFCDEKSGSLYVPGAEKDIQNISNLIDNNEKQIKKIIISLEDHPYNHISNTIAWINEYENHPDQFTTISEQDVRSEVWRSSRTSDITSFKNYIIDLNANKRFTHTVYPPHCVSGTPGQNIHPILLKSIHNWQIKNPSRNISYIRKGNIYNREQYSLVKPEVPINGHSDINMDFVMNLINSENHIYFCGEALSHCVSTTILDVIDTISNKDIQYNFICRLRILTDCTSSVCGFEKKGKNFLDKFYLKGCLKKSTDLIY